MVDAVCWQPWRLSWRKKLYISLLDANFLVWYKQLRLSVVSYLFDVALKESYAELHHVTVIECRWSDTVFVQYLIVIHAELLAMPQLDTTQLCTRITLPISVGPTPDLYSVGVNVVKFARAFDIIFFEIFPTTSQICTAEAVENRFIESATTGTRLDQLWTRLAENAYFDWRSAWNENVLAIIYIHWRRIAKERMDGWTNGRPNYWMLFNWITKVIPPNAPCLAT